VSKPKGNKPRKVRRDSRLKALPVEQRALIAGWLAEDGAPSCLQRMLSELGIKSNQTSLYEAIAYWEVQEKFSTVQAKAIALAQNEADTKGKMSVEEMEEAIDRHFILQAAEAKDSDLYTKLRTLRIQDQAAKSGGRIAMEKLRHSQRKLEQKDRDFKLLEAKFRRDTAELFLDWSSDQKAKDIVASGASRAEKIEALGQAMFGEDW